MQPFNILKLSLSLILTFMVVYSYSQSDTTSVNSGTIKVKKGGSVKVEKIHKYALDDHSTINRGTEYTINSDKFTDAELSLDFPLEIKGGFKALVLYIEEHFEFPEDNNKFYKEEFTMEVMYLCTARTVSAEIICKSYPDLKWRYKNIVEKSLEMFDVSKARFNVKYTVYLRLKDSKR